MNIAIVGSNGYIAGYLRNELVNHGHVILRIDKDVREKKEEGMGTENVQKLDLAHPEVFNYSILESVEFVIFTAAISSPDKCAADFDLCWKVNVEGTKYFIRETISRECKVLFFSSDAVYGDNPECIYDEKSETKAFTAYGKMKKDIEDEFRDSKFFKTIRLSYVMSANDRFVSYCLNCLRSGETADVFHPFYRNVISITDVVKVTAWFALHFDDYKPRFLNVAGEELVSRVRMVDEINRMYKNRLNYKISKPAESFFKNRPAIMQMKSLYLEKYDILQRETFTEKIQKELEAVRI